MTMARRYAMGAAVLGGAAVLLWLAVSLAPSWFRPSPSSTNPAGDGPVVVSEAPAQPIRPDDPVLVRFTLDNSYPEPPAVAADPAVPSAQQLLDAALQVLPARQVTLNAAMSIAAIIEQQYGLVNSSHPSAVSAISAAIRLLNEGRIDGEVLTPGDLPVRVPLVAPLAGGDDSSFASVAVRAGRTQVTNEPLRTPGGEELTAVGPVKPRFTNYFMRAEIRDLADGQPLQLLSRSPAGRTLAKPIDVTLASGQGTPQPVFEAPSDKEWTDRVHGAPRTVFLYVLDTGWPDAAAAADSIAELQSLFAAARDWYRFPPVPQSSVPVFQPPKNPHVSKVHTALQELRALSTKVKVVYVPMTTDQGAEPILRELVTLGLVISNLPRQGRTRPEGSDTREALKLVTPAAITEAMKGLVAAGAGGTFTTNLAALRGLYLVAQMRGRETIDPYFVSQSWTTTDPEVNTSRLPESPNGFVVAAVGNQPGLDVTGKLAFAGWSDMNKQVLAVMTFNANGQLGCQSSGVTLWDGDLGAVGYLGEIASPKECASSYATPRVAWYLAARDSLRTAPVVSEGQWVSDIRARIAGLRKQGAPLPQSLLFDPVNYVR